MKDGIHGSCAAQGWNCPKKRKKLTNADRIRSMSDEELVEFIAGLNEHCLAGIGECDCSNEVNPCCEVCEKVTRKWLQSESEG